MSEMPRWQCAALLAVDAALVLAVATHATGGWRVLLAIAFSSSVPGGAILAHRAPADPGARAALVLALSWMVMVLVNDALIELGWWNPELVLVILGLACGASLGLRVFRARPSGFAPLAVAAVDCAQPFDDIPLPADGRAAAVRILVSRGHEPLGFVTIPFRDGRVSAAAIDEAIRSEFGDALAVAERTPTDQPEISVVVCTRDRPERLRSCLAALANLDYARFEVVVVDNAPETSATAAADIVSALADPRFRTVVEPRPGLSRARNTGVAAAEFDLIAFVDDDTVADAWWLAAVARGFARSETIGCVTGLVPAADLSTPSQQFFDQRVSWARSCQPRHFALAGNQPASPLYPYAAGQFGTGANMAFRRAALADLGHPPFDEALGAGSPAGGGEDLAAFVGILHHGWTIAYEPAAVVWHNHRADFRALRRQMNGYGRGLSAFVTGQLRHRERAREIARRLPEGLLLAGRLLRASAGRVERPRSLVWAEFVGLAQGPFAYIRGRRLADMAGVER